MNFLDLKAPLTMNNEKSLTQQPQHQQEGEMTDTYLETRSVLFPCEWY